jgi:hypothetical protein
VDASRPAKPRSPPSGVCDHSDPVSVAVSACSVTLRLGPAVVLAGLVLTSSALALPACLEAQRKVDEANALRFQARQEMRVGDHDRVCDTLDEVGDRYDDARDAFERCGEGVVAIDLRSELRRLRIAKKIHRCD